MAKSFFNVSVCLIFLSIVTISGCKENSTDNKKLNNNIIKYKDLKPPPSVDSINTLIAIQDLKKIIASGQNEKNIETFYNVIKLPKIPFLNGTFYVVNDKHVRPSPEATFVIYNKKIMPLYAGSFNFREILRYNDKLTKSNVTSLVKFMLKELGDYRVISDAMKIPGRKDINIENPPIIRPLFFKQINNKKSISCYSWSPYTRNIFKLNIELSPDSSSISFVKTYYDK